MIEPAYGMQPEPLQGELLPPEEAVDETSGVPLVDFSLKLSPDRLEKLGRTIKREIDRYFDATERRRANQMEWRRSRENFPTGLPGPWPGSSDVSGHLTEVYCRADKQKLNAAIIHVEPPFTARSNNPEIQDYVEPAEESLNGVMEEAEWRQVADNLHSELGYGNCFLRLTFEQEFRRVPRVTTEVSEEDFQALLRAGADGLTAFLQSQATDAKGRPKLELAFENELVYSGIRLKLIKWEDGVILPATIRDPKDKWGIGERLMIQGAELQRGAESGKYIKDAVEDLLTRSGDMEPDQRQETLDLQGVDVGTGNTYADDPAYNAYDCFDLDWLMDANDDGEQEWCVITLHYPTGKILGAHYLPYEHGESRFHLFRNETRPGELFGTGPAEKVACVQAAYTAALNQIINYQDLVINAGATLICDDTAGLDPDKDFLQMGKLLRVQDIRGIKEMPVPQMPAQAYNLLASLKDMGDLLTSTSNPSLGKETSGSKTLGEVQIVQGASNMMAEDKAAHVARQWALVCHQVRWLMAQYGQDDEGMVKYRRTARAGAKITTNADRMGSIPAEILKGDLDFIPTGLGQLSDLTTRIQIATSVMTALIEHPLTAQNTEVQQLVLNQYLHDFHYPIREKVMMAIEKGLAAQRAVAEEMQTQLAAPSMGPEGEPPTGAGATAGPPPPSGAPPTANLPEMQGPQGDSGVAGAATGPMGIPLPPQPGGYRG